MGQLDPSVEQARQDVLTARQDLLAQVGQLPGAIRSAGDIGAFARRDPGKAAAVLGGLATLLVVPLAMIGKLFGGGGKKKSKRGKKAKLPKDVEATLASMGPEGDEVRTTLERDFADYLSGKPRHEQQSLTRSLLGSVAIPVAGGLARAALKSVAEGGKGSGKGPKKRARRLSADDSVEASSAD